MRAKTLGRRLEIILLISCMVFTQLSMCFATDSLNAGQGDSYVNIGEPGQSYADMAEPAGDYKIMADLADGFTETAGETAEMVEPAEALIEMGESVNGFTDYLLLNRGAWCWFADPRAIHYETPDKSVNMTYIGCIDASGTIKAVQYDHNTKERKDITVRQNFDIDDHNNPTLLVLPDGRIMIFYARHTVDLNIYYRVTKTPYDMATLGEEKFVTSTTGKITYPTPFLMSDDPDHIYMCWRGINWHPTIGKIDIPDEQGNTRFTWGPYQLMQSTGARPYTKFSSNGRDRIYMTYTTGHPDAEYPNWVYYNQIDINTLSLLDVKGNKLRTIADGPLPVNKTEAYYNPCYVVDNPTTFRDWVWEIRTDQQGNPVIAMVRIDQPKKSHNYYYVRWNGSEWKKTFLSNAGGAFHQTANYEECYSGGMSIDKANPNVIYCSIPIEGEHGKVYEIVKFTIGPGGEIAAKEQLTKNSVKNNVRPYSIQGIKEDSRLTLCWMYGDYYAWVGAGKFDTQLHCNLNLLAESRPKGEGTKEEPYLIENVNEFKYIAEEITAGNTFKGKHFLQTANLDLAAAGFAGIDQNVEFSGIYDGGGYEVNVGGSGLIGRNCGGMFGTLTGATIMNLGLTGTITINTGMTHRAGLAGNIRAGSKIVNCYSNISVQAGEGAGTLVTQLRYGGFAWWAQDTAFLNCYFGGSIPTGKTYGPFAGYTEAAGTVTVEDGYYASGVTFAYDTKGTGSFPQGNPMAAADMKAASFADRLNGNRERAAAAAGVSKNELMSWRGSGGTLPKLMAFGETPVVSTDAAITGKTMTKWMNRSAGYGDQNTILQVQTGLPAGRKLQYLGSDGTAYPMYYSAVLNAYLTAVPELVEAQSIRENLRVVNGTGGTIKYGIVADGWQQRGSMTYEDLSYFDTMALKLNTVPPGEFDRAAAMDVNGDFNLDINDFNLILSHYLRGTPVLQKAGL